MSIYTDIILEYNNLIYNNTNTEGELDGVATDEMSHKIDIYRQKRNARKSITIIQGLSPPVTEKSGEDNGKEDIEDIGDMNIELKKFLKKAKKKLSCNGHISNDEKFGNVVVLQGDHRETVVPLIKKYFTNCKITLHG
jgi:translation initiation factor 1 (eIF-1/SUI1)